LRRDRLALHVDMLAEQEMTMVLRMLTQICERLGIEPDAERDERARKLMEETNVYELMEKVDQKFGKP
jgi:ribosomal protein L12E/L44/L45/RPP1/RPP2